MSLKNPQDLEKLREIGRIVRLTLDKTAEAVRPGVTTAELDAVGERLLMEHGAVSAPVAEAMAEGIRKRARTDFGLAVTGIAGPGGGSEEKPVGLIYIALADDAHTEHRKFIIPGDRNLIRWRASQAALDLLRRRLI